MKNHYFDGPDYEDKLSKEEIAEIKGEEKFEHDRNHGKERDFIQEKDFEQSTKETDYEDAANDYEAEQF